MILLISEQRGCTLSIFVIRRSFYCSTLNDSYSQVQINLHQNTLLETKIIRLIHTGIICHTRAAQASFGNGSKRK